MAKNEEGKCQVRVCVFDLPKVKSRTSKVVGFDAAVVCP